MFQFFCKMLHYSLYKYIYSDHFDTKISSIDQSVVKILFNIFIHLTFDLPNLHVRVILKSDNTQKMKDHELRNTLGIVVIRARTLLAASISSPLFKICHQSIKNLMKNLKLIDTWRTKNANKLQFTWRQKTTNIYRRLD